MNRSLNILIAIESFWDGGAEMFAIRLANDISLNCNVCFVELYPYRSIPKKQIRLIDSSRVHLLQIGKNNFGDWLYKKRKNSSNRLFHFLRILQEKLIQFQIKFILKKYKINVVNSHSWDTDLYFANLKDSFDYNLVSTFHGHYEFLKNIRADFEKNTTFILSRVNNVIYTSSKHIETLDSYICPQLVRHKIFYGISHTIASTPTFYKKGEVLKIIMAARGIIEKGWEQAILAVIALSVLYPEKIELDLYGEGPHLDYLKSKYQYDNIQFHGYIEDVKSVICNSHIGILPTYYSAESLPNSVIEYLVCGKPVISTKIGAIEEMINVNGKSAGKCLDISIGIADVADLILTLEDYIINPDQVEKHSHLALEAAKKFTMEACVLNYLKVFSN